MDRLQPAVLLSTTRPSIVVTIHIVVESYLSGDCMLTDKISLYRTNFTLNLIFILFQTVLKDVCSTVGSYRKSTDFKQVFFCAYTQPLVNLTNCQYWFVANTKSMHVAANILEINLDLLNIAFCIGLVLEAIN